MRIKFILLQKDGLVQPAFKFAFWTFIVELALSIFVFSSIAGSVRFDGFINQSNALAMLVILYFFLRVGFIHFALGIILRIVEWAFDIKQKGALYILVLIYAYLYLAILYPQNFDEFP
ncbi:MAG: hypothetical protein EOP04_16730, partial [Proteobacteria bacterium]